MQGFEPCDAPWYTPTAAKPPWGSSRFTIGHSRNPSPDYFPVVAGHVTALWTQPKFTIPLFRIYMTLQQAQAQYDEILATLGVTEAQYRDRKFSFSSGDARLKELAFLEELISDLTNQSTTPTRCTLATYRRS